jgi:acetylornithine deacetylase/succinyl-diaminopimelate desuccinylase-like protein
MDTEFVPRETSRLLRELNELLAIPSISTLPANAGDCRRAAAWLVDHLSRLGCSATLLEGDGHPIVWAESPPVPGAPTLLIYGHYDVQPVDPIGEWISAPFEPTVRDGQLFARGAADDKGQVFCLIKAYEAACGGGAPPVNVRFLIEGEEECGGHLIAKLLQEQPERARADAVLVCDMAYYAKGWPAVYTALRGICYAEIEVRTTKRDLHSGTYGGVAPNAVETLCRLLMDLKGRDGVIAMPDLYDRVDPPTAVELAGWATLPFDETSFTHDEVTSRALVGVEDRSVFERTWALPTLEIHGIRGGFVGDGAKTVIPALATAKVSMRLVPAQSYEFAREQLREACRRLGPDYADVDVRFIHGADPVQVDVTARVFQSLDQAFQEVVGRPTVSIRAGGSIPVVTDLARGGGPVLLTGIGLPDDGLHSPNEKLDLQQLWDGIRVFARFYELLGEASKSTA